MATTASSQATETTRPVVKSNLGIVATAHPLASEAGQAVLADGGNAVDAAVAAALVTAVTMPEMCGLGGDLFAIVHRPGYQGSTGENVAFLGSGIAPRQATIEQMRAHGERDGTLMPYRGPLAVSVPGMVDAYFALLGRFGSRSFAELAEAAIGHAEQGYALTPAGAKAIADNAELLGSFPSSAAVFLAGGQPPTAGEVLRQRDLARTLRAIAAGGSDVFYRGIVAQAMADFMAANGGAMTIDDLAEHRTEITRPIATTYREHTVYQTGLPSQGMIHLETMNILAQADSATVGDGDDAAIHLQAEALKLAIADRLAYAGDPAFVRTPLDRLLSPEWAAGRYALIDPQQATDDVPVAPLSDGDTTYLCAVDSQGMMVSLIQSVSAAFGCGVVAGETGVVLNNRAGRGFTLEPNQPNTFAPGKKTMHTLNAWLVCDAEGRGVIVGGTPGGDGQPQWNTQMLVNLLDAGLDVQAAIERPRWMVWPATDPSTRPNPYELRIEARVGPSVLSGLQRRRHRVRAVGNWAGGGAAQIIARDPESGMLSGGSDPRAEGSALGV